MLQLTVYYRATLDASARYVMVLCLSVSRSVCLSACYKPVLYQNG